MPKFSVVSTDSHVIIPPNELAARIPKRFRDQAAALKLSEDMGSEQLQKMRRISERAKEKMNEEDLERSRAGGWDPKLRLADQDRDGVSAEIMFGPLFFDNSKVAGLDLAVSQAFNDWSKEIFGTYFNRLMPSAAVAVADIPAAVAEIERIAKMGFTCVNLPAQQPHLPYNRLDYDPLWAVLQDTGIVANFHIGTGHLPQAERGPGGPTINYVLHAQGDGPNVVTYLCSSGVLERFPGFQWAVVESDAAWLAWVLQAMDNIHHSHHMYQREWDKLELLPSEYFKRQGHVCFMDDAVAVHNRKFTGVHTIMFGTDYPHHEGTFPHTEKTIERIFEGVPDEEIRMMVGGTAAKLYGLDIN